MKSKYFLAGMMVASITSLSQYGSAKAEVRILREVIRTWQETMVDCRNGLPELASIQAEAIGSREIGPWYSTGPIKGGKFTDRSLAEKPVDLQAVDTNGKNLWQRTDNIRDGEIFQARFENKLIEPIYLYRQIKADKDVTLAAGFGSRNTLEVWLNGKMILTSIKERGPVKNQHILELGLKPGVNELLVRIFNWKGRAEFCFSPQVDPALRQCREISQKFPVECGWAEKDLGADGCTALLAERNDPELEKKMIETVLGQIAAAGQGLREELLSISASEAAAGDKRWLDLYVSACRLREAMQQVQRENARLSMLIRACKSLVNADPNLAAWADEYQKRLAALEEKLGGLELSSEAENRHKLRSVGQESLNLERELITKKPSPSTKGAYVLDATHFKAYVESFNAMDKETIVNFIPNAAAWDWMKINIPFFECPDKEFEKIYYYRWWTFRKHIKQTEDGLVLTEFLDKVGHSGKHNTISCALGHHIFEGRWLHDSRYIGEYAMFWYRGDNGGPQPHFHRYSNWTGYALYNRYLVNKDGQFIVGLLDDFISDFRAWEKERGLANKMFWQYDTLDGGEESICGSRTQKHNRPQLNSYIYGSLWTIAKVAKMAGKDDLANEYEKKAAELKSLVEKTLWDVDAKFFKVRLEDGNLCDAREAIGFVPWYFNLPEAGHEEAWLQIRDPMGFKAPMGLTTAERRHPAFRSHGVGTCEWDGAVWPFATSQTLAALANVLRNYKQEYVTEKDYFDSLVTYARSHKHHCNPYIGEYLDEASGHWLTPDSDRSRFYNHSTFCDLVIAGLVGLVPREDDVLEVHPLMPEAGWDWFCLDNVSYHGKILTIIWDRNGRMYRRGSGLLVWADGKEIAHRDTLGRLTGRLP